MTNLELAHNIVQLNETINTLQGTYKNFLMLGNEEKANECKSTINDTQKLLEKCINTFYSLRLERKIYIIESLADNDINKNRSESSSLIEILKLHKIPYSPFTIKTKTEFYNALISIIDDFNKISTQTFIQPILHISAHGLDTGVGIILTNDDIITWQEISDYLILFHKQTNTSENTVSTLLICLSVCNSAGINVILKDGINPFMGIIAPEITIPWTTALLAFHTFYFHLIERQATLKEAFEKMQISSDYKFFKRIHSNNIIDV